MVIVLGIRGPDEVLLAPLPLVVTDKHIDRTDIDIIIDLTIFADRTDRKGVTRERNRPPEQVTCFGIEGADKVLLAPVTCVVTGKHIDRTGIDVLADRTDRKGVTRK